MHQTRERIGIDIIGFGPIARELSKLIAVGGRGFRILSISDSNITIYPEDRIQVLRAITWKESSRAHKLSELRDLKHGSEGESIDGVKHSKASIVVDATNSDYGRPREALARAEAALKAGKHLVSANKVALANYFHEILEHAHKKTLGVGFGATICGARHAVRVAQSLEEGEILSASAVLNASTTLILSRLEDSNLSFDEACVEAGRSRILESDWGVDLDGIDAAAKTAILANVLFPKARASINLVKRKGIRDPKTRQNIERARGSPERIRLVSDIEKNRASVAPKSLSHDSPLLVYGKSNAVSIETKNLGDISVKSPGGGVSLTASILLSDISELARRLP